MDGPVPVGTARGEDYLPIGGAEAVEGDKKGVEANEGEAPSYKNFTE